MGTHPMIFIRTDGNSDIASGHLVRCISIAQAILTQAFVLHTPVKICFLVSDEDSQRLLLTLLGPGAALYTIRVLENANYQKLSKELPCLLPILEQNPSSVFLLDSYFVNPDYLKEIRKCCKVAYLDDLQAFDYDVDLVINYDVIPSCQVASYEAAYTNAAKKMLGAAYAPLRVQFSREYFPLACLEGLPAARRSILEDFMDVENLEPEVSKPQRLTSHVLVTSGGSDPCHFELELMQYWLQSEKVQTCLQEHPSLDICFHLIAGVMNADKQELMALVGRNSFIKISESVRDMASIMTGSHLAVSAGGTTLYELCAIGVPAISYCFADNQLINAEAFSNVSAIPYAGDIRVNKEQVFARICDFILDMSLYPAKRKPAHDIMHRLVDGQGAVRIAKELIGFSQLQNPIHPSV